MIVAAIVLVVVPVVLLVSIAVTGLTDIAERVLGENSGADLATLNDLLQEVYLALIGVMGLFYGPIALVMAKHVVEVVGKNDAG